MPGFLDFPMLSNFTAEIEVTSINHEIPCYETIDLIVFSYKHSSVLSTWFSKCLLDVLPSDTIPRFTFIQNTFFL
jgi:hypothetical protein